MYFDYTVLIKLVLAVAVSGVIGYEREKRDRPAGIRTHMLLCLGSTILTIAALESFGGNIDSAARVAAGILTGIGFLGAGTIISSEKHVMGLTTAAGLWVVAGLGIVIGLGHYFLAMIGSVMIILILETIRSKPKENNGTHDGGQLTSGPTSSGPK